MLKQLTFTMAALVCGATGAHADSWQDAVKQSIDATWHPPQVAGIGDPAMPLAAIGTGDLSPDPNFGAGGQTQYYLDYGSNLEGWGLRVVAIPGGAGWYVLAKHGAGNGTWDAVVVKVQPGGAAETTYVVPTPMFRLDDATIDAVTGKFYFAGGAKQAGHADSDFAVTCVDINAGPSGGPCAGFGSGGTAYVPFDRATGNKDDVARRVLVRPNLGVLLGGWAKDGPDGYVFAAAALFRESGSLVTRFGSGGKFTTDLGMSLANLDVNVYDMALSNDADNEARLYIAGNYSRNTARKDYDGVVLALNAWTGAFDPGFNGVGFRSVYLDLGDPAVDLSDAVTAIAVQANGKLALAGWSRDTYLNTRLMLARLNTDGAFDNGFCDGFGAGKCARDVGNSSGLPGYFWPTAIAERSNSRDLVIATEYRPGGTGADADQARQVAVQLSANANAARTEVRVDYSVASGQTPYSVTTGMLVTTDAVMIAGTRRWHAPSNDFDVTLVRTLAKDTIYADTFGGARSD